MTPLAWIVLLVGICIEHELVAIRKALEKRNED